MPAELHLSEGRVIRAPAVVLATDGFTPALGFLRRYVYALHTCAVATEPLTSEALSSMGWHGREIVFEAARTGHTFLLTPDNRVLCRGLFRYGFRDSLAPVDQKRIRGALGTAITERFPKLAGVPLEYAWSGVIGMTRTYRPAIGRLDAPGEVLHAVGYSGHGLAYGTLAGRLLAELHLGQSSSELEYALEHSLPKRLPPEPFRWLGFHGATRWMRGSEK
jgi:glycine/D-amino acid oxidase-like deaminating enzyme